MSSTPSIPCPQPPESASDRALRHGAMLRELGEIGMRVARAMGERAAAAAEIAEVSPAEAAATAAGFARVARAVRQTLALEARLAEGPPPRRTWREAQGLRPGPKARLGDDSRWDDPDDEDRLEEREWLGEPSEDEFAGLDLEAGVEALTAAVRRQSAETRAVLDRISRRPGLAGTAAPGAVLVGTRPPEPGERRAFDDRPQWLREMDAAKPSSRRAARGPPEVF